MGLNLLRKDNFTRLPRDESSPVVQPIVEYVTPQLSVSPQWTEVGFNERSKVSGCLVGESYHFGPWLGACRCRNIADSFSARYAALSPILSFTALKSRT